MDRLADDNRVIHHDAEHQQEREQRDHIQANARVGQQEESAQKRYRNAHRYPYSDRRPKEQYEHQKNEQQPTEAILQQRFDPALERHCGVAPKRQGRTLRQVPTLVRDPLVNDAGRLHHIRVGRDIGI